MTKKLPRVKVFIIEFFALAHALKGDAMKLCGAKGALEAEERGA